MTIVILAYTEKRTTISVDNSIKDIILNGPTAGNTKDIGRYIGSIQISAIRSWLHSKILLFGQANNPIGPAIKVLLQYYFFKSVLCIFLQLVPHKRAETLNIIGYWLLTMNKFIIKMETFSNLHNSNSVKMINFSTVLLSDNYTCPSPEVTTIDQIAINL